MTACDRCLSRAWLVARLSAHIERATGDAPGHRAPDLLALSDDELIEALAPRHAATYRRQLANLDLGPLRAAVRGTGSWARCRHDYTFPRSLTRTDGPRVLFARGDPRLLDSLKTSHSVTVVGARRPSSYGREMATGLGRELASAGLAVVSGMALGIDSCAHRGALEAGGLTIAVLGSGADVPHPARMRRLYEEICERGLVLSELPPGTQPRRWTFPARNRIMAALGQMTVVVEARERSGSLITSGMASDLGREVGAVPGRVGASPSAGANGLLRDGAQVIRSARDVLDSLLGPGAEVPRRAAASGPALEAELSAVLEAVERGSGGPDAVVQDSGLTPGAAAGALARLEILGYLRVDAAGRYQRTTLAAESVA